QPARRILEADPRLRLGSGARVLRHKRAAVGKAAAAIKRDELLTERARGPDQRHGPVALLAPHVDEVAVAAALARGLPDLPPGRDDVAGPDDVHEPHVELPAGVEPVP